MDEADPRVAQQIARAASVAEADPRVAQQIAQAASAFEERRTGHAPQSVSVVLAADTLVVTLHGTLSEAEKVMARTPEGAARLQELHRRLFDGEAESLREEIRRITGVAVREARAAVEPATGTVVQVFTTGTMVQVFLMAGPVSADNWAGTHPSDKSASGPASPSPLSRSLADVGKRTPSLDGPGRPVPGRPD
jgi:uncharacterized protein YbcI